MVKRLFDIILSLISLIFFAPIFIVAALGIKVSSRGPILYRAARVGKNGKTFTMYKFRTMHEDHGSFSSAITGIKDPRISRFGSLLRRLKIDELPQLFNVVKGDMSIVGPRPEDPQIVNKYYTPEHYETLTVLPGLASPGSIYNYTHDKQYLANDNYEKSYVERLLPVKLALERVYVKEASFFYDLRIIIRTIRIILSIALGKRNFPEPVEIEKISTLDSVKTTKKVLQ